ncbi:uncharacterized protein LOC130719122 [Lotus japonicus]|uniref:uncharacterized protein LOC130719122 n=1 Tax=Lotus japonicus TaxID=34305 RepID=UPI00258729C0|nr:uncharacterized protein LOC130719122 [Lotus japonicus]
MLVQRTIPESSLSIRQPVLVSDLILRDSNEWDSQRISEIFTQPEVDMIMKIPLPLQAIEDKLMWSHTKQGNYTVKSPHHAILFNSDEASSSNPSPHSLWTKIWGAETQPRCKEFMWRTIQNAIPVKLNLFRRGIPTDLTCPLCGEAQESTCHAILTCPEVRSIWFLSPLGLHINLGEGMDLRSWLDLTLSSLPEIGQNWVFSVAWAIWKRRNLWVFDQKRLTPEQVINQASSMNISEAEPREGHMNQNSPIPPRWKPPRPGAFKANFDASVHEDTGTGLGAIFRNHEGKAIIASSFHLRAAYEPAIAEALSLRRTINMAKDENFRIIELESDCLQLVQAWDRSVPHNNYLASIVQDCKDLSSFLDSCSLKHCSRNINGVADHLAKLAFVYQDHFWVGNDPPGTSLLLQQDVVCCTRFEVSTS